jgi:TPR repeat protein
MFFGRRTSKGGPFGIMELASTKLVRASIANLALSLPLLADFDAAKAALARGDYATALKEFQPLAAAGNAEAQSNIGLLYQNGWGVRQSYEGSNR